MGMRDCLMLLNKLFIICKRDVVLSGVGCLGWVMLFVWSTRYLW